jgi:hypothetical protein
MYKSEFFNAVERAKQFGLNVPEITEMESRLLSDEAQAELPLIIHNTLGVLEEEEILLQCLLLNLRLKKVFSDYFKSSVYYTIGYIEIDDAPMFKQTEESLRKMLENGIEGPSINLHAWLTLPSMEILDFSISTSYGRVNGIKEMMGKALAMHPDELTGGMKYRPMLVGEEFLLQTGAMKLVVDIGI